MLLSLIIILFRDSALCVLIFMHTPELRHCFGFDSVASLSAGITAKRYPGGDGAKGLGAVW